MALFCYLSAVSLNVIWLLFRGVLSFWIQVAIPLLTVVLLGAGAGIRVSYMKRKYVGHYLGRVLWVMFLYYLTIVTDMLFFGRLFQLERGWGGAVNLEPLHTIRNFFIHYQRTGSLASLFNLLGNIAILIPVGVFIPLLFRGMRRFWLFIPFAALVSAGIEYIQWYTALGVADVDDSILNFAGAVGGYFITRLCQMVWFFLRKRKRAG